MIELTMNPYAKVENEQFPQEVKFVFKKNDFENVQFKDGTTTYAFFNCNFKKVVIENLEEIEFASISLAFFDCYIEDFKCDTIVSKNISIDFFSSIISGVIRENNLQSVGFNNCIIRSNFFLVKLNRVSVSYTEENIYPRRWKSFLDSVGITNYKDLLKQKQAYYLEDCKKINFYFNEKVKEKRGFYIREYIDSKESRLGYCFKEEERKTFNINLDLKYSIGSEDIDTKVNNAYLKSFSVSGSPVGKLSIESTRIESWYLREFMPKGEVLFYDIAPLSNGGDSSKIEFHKSNFDNSWFDNVDFKEYAVVSFFRSKFSKTIFTSCNFPNNYISFEKFTTLENIHYKEKIKANYFKDKYETFLQLKMSMESTGNIHEAQKFQATSNDALKYVNDVSKWDKFILFVNSKSNNHGLSFIIPLKLFLLFSIAFYILYLLSLGRIFNSNDFDPTLFGYYFSFIDITHRSDFLVDKSEFTGWGTWALVIDAINKIVISFFIYQFIAAFRKYGRK